MRLKGRLKLYNDQRLRLVVGGFVLIFGAIVIRLAFVQVFQHAYLRDIAARQHSRQITLQPERGRILDRHGRVLATSVPVPSAYAIPQEIEHPESAAKKVAEVLGQPVATVKQQLTSTAPFVWLARQLSPDMGERIQKLNIRGVQILQETRRFYPKRHLAGQILGFVGVDGQGLGGLEHLYQRELTGTPRRVTLQRDATGRTVQVVAGDPNEQPRGADLYLTLDERLQYVAEKEIAIRVQETQARSGLVLVMHPASGDILALAGYPFFNPNDFQDPKQRPWQRNRAVTDPVEPGSTFKLVAAAAALEENVVRLTDTFHCENGFMLRGGRRLRDHHGYGVLSFAQVIEKSSNIGTAKIAERLSDTQFYHYIRRFGFGEKTQVRLPGEEEGFVRTPKKWSRLTHDSLAIGQEITVTALQLVNAYAAIANGGWLMRPRLVEHIIQGDDSQFFAPEARHRVLSPQVVERMNEILAGVVERGTGKQAAVEGYTAAGKTGTAQKVEHGAYSHSKVLASFVGYVPAEAPQLAIVAMIDEPQVAKWGGEAAAPVFKKVAQQALYYLQVPSRQNQTLAADGTLQPVAPAASESARSAAPAGAKPGSRETVRAASSTGTKVGDREPSRVAMSTGAKTEKERRP
ncbi:MAG: peptidoglycan D,D-transpeptidase FtsI family protein [Candidatus Tectimicrobiota bacterium]